MVNYDRRFVKNFSDLTLPLLKLLKKSARWIWYEEQERAFQAIKNAHLNTTVVSHPNFEKGFYIQADSSGYGLGCCLFQLGENNERNVLAYNSRTLRGPELRYTTTEKEALAIVFACQKWRVICIG